ncbi:plasmid replication initiator protein [Methylobacterium platani]|uniref:Plasmid replication initiator protein n=3 Tax=Methylobacterium platani TaxID=427683 RepID=A0A179SGI5_9HYPH|nr:plasmid replication initiator protein [Methylobacterium platani]
MTMSHRRNDQIDMVVPFVHFRDQRETMERPFFSIAKQKRLKEIDYTSPDGSVWVRVLPNQAYGMATIWDADILIWAASTICEMKKRGRNDIPRKLNFMPYDLLKGIGRETGGRQYKLLRDALFRLQSTSVRTNIRAEKAKRKERQFSWIDAFDDTIDEETNASRGMSITLSDWFYEGVLMDGGVLAIDPAYFGITGGRERWLYRIARKHAGGAGEGGFAISLPTLFEKSGAEGTYRRFKFEIAKIAKADELPGFVLRLEEKERGEPHLRMIRRDLATEAVLIEPAPKPKRTRKPKASAELPLFRHLSDETIALCRKAHPGWDVYGLKTEFDHWLEGDSDREPKNYESAFLGFAERFVRDAR